MKTLAVALVAFGALSGCVVYPVGGRHCYRQCGEQYGVYRSDRNTVADRYDRRPDNPRGFEHARLTTVEASRRATQ